MLRLGRRLTVPPGDDALTPISSAGQGGASCWGVGVESRRRDSRIAPFHSRQELRAGGGNVNAAKTEPLSGNGLAHFDAPGPARPQFAHLSMGHANRYASARPAAHPTSRFSPRRTPQPRHPGPENSNRGIWFFGGIDKISVGRYSYKK